MPIFLLGSSGEVMYVSHAKAREDYKQFNQLFLCIILTTKLVVCVILSRLLPFVKEHTFGFPHMIFMLCIAYPRSRYANILIC